MFTEKQKPERAERSKQREDVLVIIEAMDPGSTSKPYKKYLFQFEWMKLL